jgi:hypothetical protein
VRSQRLKKVDGTVSRSNVGMRRLYHQRIAHPSFKNAGEVVAWLGAMQGQDYAGTKWAFGLRLPGSTELDIEQSISDGMIMRTWLLRGTLHYVAPADIHWMLSLIAPRQIAGNALRYKALKLDESTLARSTTTIAEALQVGKQLTRSELFAILETSGISTAGQRGYYMLQRAGLEQIVYQGEVRRGETTFLALGEGKTLAKEEALAQLARRYFSSHGPATLADFTHWSGLLISEARAGLETIKSELVEETIVGTSYWLSPETAQQPEQPLYLLPGFDEYVLGYKDRSGVLDAQFASAICPGGNGVFMPTIVSEGRIIGTWKRTLKKKTVEMSFQPFRPLHTEETEVLSEAAARFGAFLGLTPVIQFV